jgi:uncharacterized protein YcbK (DUF882 family)
LRELIDSYFERAGTYLHITSGFRSPQAQAEAMYHNLRAYGKSYVSRVYGGSAAAIAIIELYSGNQKNRAAAINSMAAIIQSQVAAGVYVSRHLLGKAFDIRLRGTNLSVLRKIVRSLGGRLGVERDHYHVEF